MKIDNLLDDKHLMICGNKFDNPNSLSSASVYRCLEK